MEIEVKVLDERAAIPQYATDYSAGLDLVACIAQPLILFPGAPANLIPTGLAIYIDRPAIMGVILPRSGNGHKRGLVLGNTAGIIDADYQGPLMISAWNRNTPTQSDMLGISNYNDRCITIQPGERIAQLIFVPIVRATFRQVEEFTNNTARGAGGFGSTGV